MCPTEAPKRQLDHAGLVEAMQKKKVGSHLPAQPAPELANTFMPALGMRRMLGAACFCTTNQTLPVLVCTLAVFFSRPALQGQPGLCLRVVQLAMHSLLAG